MPHNHVSFTTTWQHGAIASMPPYLCLLFIVLFILNSRVRLTMNKFLSASLALCFFMFASKILKIMDEFTQFTRQRKGNSSETQQLDTSNLHTDFKLHWSIRAILGYFKSFLPLLGGGQTIDSSCFKQQQTCSRKSDISHPSYNFSVKSFYCKKFATFFSRGKILKKRQK